MNNNIDEKAKALFERFMNTVKCTPEWEHCDNEEKEAWREVAREAQGILEYPAPTPEQIAEQNRQQREWEKKDLWVRLVCAGAGPQSADCVVKDFTERFHQ